MKNFEIKWIWIEVELRDDETWEFYEAIGRLKWVTYWDYWLYKDRNVWLDEKINFRISREYYTNQVEWNFGWLDKDNIEGINLISKYIVDLKRNYWFSTIASAPEYVWTHIHLLINRKWKILEKKLRWIKDLVVYDYTLWFLLNHYNMVYNTAKKVWNLDIARKEIERLMINHNILINMDRQDFKWLIENIWCKYTCRNYYYTNNSWNTKYRPVIWVDARPGKPLSLEVRALPNSILMKENRLVDFIWWLEDTLNKKQSTKERYITDICNKLNWLWMLYIKIEKKRISIINEKKNSEKKNTDIRHRRLDMPYYSVDLDESNNLISSFTDFEPVENNIEYTTNSNNSGDIRAYISNINKLLNNSYEMNIKAELITEQFYNYVNDLYDMTWERLYNYTYSFIWYISNFLDLDLSRSKKVFGIILFVLSVSSDHNLWLPKVYKELFFNTFKINTNLSFEDYLNDVNANAIDIIMHNKMIEFAETIESNTNYKRLFKIYSIL